MPMSHTLAAVVYGLVALYSMGLGLTYLARPGMPYHEAATGTTWDAVPPYFRALIFNLIRIVGGGALTLGLGLAVLLWYPFRQGASWAMWAIPILILAFYLPVLYASRRISVETPANVPWHLNALICTATIVAWAIHAAAG